MNIDLSHGIKLYQNKSYEKALQEFKSFLNETKTLHLRQFLLYLKRERNYNSRSIHRKICSLKSFFKFLKKENYINSNPTESIESPKIPKSLPKT